MSRAIRLQLVGEKQQFPEINYESTYLLGYLEELGYGQFKNGSFVPLDYKIIESWKNLSELKISFREVKALMRLSSAYCESLHSAKNPECEAPFIKEL